jgi:hypothetical protein
MSLTFLTTPNSNHPINSRTIVALSSTNVAEPKFRFKFRMELNTVEIGTWYVDPDPNDYGIFDCGPRLRPFIHADDTFGIADPLNGSLFSKPASKPYVKATNGAADISIFVDENYADDAISEPYDRSVEIQNDFIAYGGSTLTNEGFNYSDGKGILINSSSQFLVENSWPIERGYQKTLLPTDRYALAFFDPQSVGYCKIIMDAIFGTPPSNIAVSANIHGDGNELMAYFCCGPIDLVDYPSLSAGQVTAFQDSTWNSYTVQAFDLSNRPLSAIYTFHRNEVACRYDKYQLMFTNRHGAWNFQTFYLMPNTKVSVSQGKEITKQIGKSVSAHGYHFDSWERELESYGKDPVLSYELQSDWLNEYEAKDLESFIYSKNVRVLINGDSNALPVIVSNRKHQHDKYKKLRQYKVTIELAQKYHLL